MEAAGKISDLNKSNDWFFEVFQNSSIGMVLIDIETTKFQFVNKAFLKFLGYTKEEVIGKTSAEMNFVEPEFREKILSQLIKQDVVNNIKISIRNKKGEPFWFLASFQIIIVQGKKCTLTSFIDITEQKKGEEKLAQLAAIVQSSEDAIISKSLDGIIKSWNKGAEKMFGFTAIEAIGNPISLIIPVGYITEEKKIIERILNNEIIEHYETIRNKKSGEQFYVSLTVSPIKNEEGIITGVSKIAHDISARKKSETELKQANKELVFAKEEKGKRAAELGIANMELAFHDREKGKREIANKELEAFSYSSKLASQYSLSLIEASRDPLVTISTEGKITDMNEATVNITGVTRKELKGSDFKDYFTDPQKASEVYQEVFEKGFVADYPLTIMDGKLTDVLFNGSVYKDDKGTVLGAVIVARDITEQKRNEKELIEAKVFAELAVGIAEEAKTKAENATLIAEDATRIAEDAVKAKQQFLSNMSHEIRTPMNAIIGFTKVVLKTDLSAKQKEYLTAIKMSGDALIVLINDILDLAKVDAGKMTFEQIPFKMELSISAMLHLFDTKIQEKNLQLVIEYDHKIPDVLVGDPVRLHQIILNLVSNAVKFTNEGKITVRVKLLDEDETKATIEFTIKDTGIGIPKNKIDTIFENFQQASSGTSRLYGGTGLGLAIVKQLVEPQGGRISVISKVDEGSSFSFILSFQKTKNIAEIESETLELNSEIKNIKVLVVEDIALNQLLMKTLLDDFGFERDIAANGKIAIEKLQRKSYDIILMDLQMPEMNGFEATDYIRNVLHSKIPIIALTADVTTVDLAKCKAVGMNDYIAKPVDERLLYTKIIGLVKKPVLTKLKEDKGIEGTKKSKCIDLGYLNHRTKSNPALMMEMISLYLEQTPPLIKAMKQSILNEDCNTLQAAVHKLIPSFSIMGISVDFENMAKKVQQYALTQKQADGISDIVLQLETICEQACNELEEEYKTIKNNNT